MSLNISSLLCYAAATGSAVLALVMSFGARRSLARWSFAAGMVVLAVESLLNGATFQATSPADVGRWQSFALYARSLLPVTWLCFSLSYSRGDYRGFLRRWRIALIVALLFPVASLFAFSGVFLIVAPQENGEVWLQFAGAAKALNAFILVGAMLVLTNLEKTFRAAVGTMQWRIKFLVLGVAVIFGARVYTQIQVLLFSGLNLSLLHVISGSLLVGCALIAVGYRRSGFGGIDVYPSRAVLHTSFTLLAAGAYLFFVGVLAQFVAERGQASGFQAQAFVVLVGIALLAVLLLSSRVRHGIRVFISRHFKRPEHDFREVWTAFTRSVSSLLDQSQVSETSAKLLSTTFHVLSVSVWLFDQRTQRLRLAASTLEKPEGALPAAEFNPPPASSRPFDLAEAREPWAVSLREATPSQFPQGGSRLCIPLLVRDRWVGVVTLTDRVNAVRYTIEEIDLLQCVGDQLATALLNIQLTAEILEGRELEAFRTMSTFFVHDLKNAASTLTLTLENLPVHFDDPEFRADALRGISKTVARINSLIERLGVLRRKLAVDAVELDLNAVVQQTLQDLKPTTELELETDLQPLPSVRADRDQLHSVFTNLLLNARDAVSPKGRVSVQTGTRNGWAVVTVADNGCGMSPEFVRESLFRPFKTTKKNGLGIGMFQSKMIVEAHGGNIQVESESGAGTTFRVLLPLHSRS